MRFKVVHHRLLLWLALLGVFPASAVGQLIRRLPPVEPVQPGGPVCVSPGVPYGAAVGSQASYDGVAASGSAAAGVVSEYAPAGVDPLTVKPQAAYAGPAAPGYAPAVAYPPVVAPPSAAAPAYPEGPDRLAQSPGSVAGLLQNPAGTGATPVAKPPPGIEIPADVRPGAFQKLILTQTYLPRGGAQDGFGSYEYELKAIFGLPCPTITSPMLVTPGFSVQELNGPESVDLPARLYEAYTEFRWMSQVRPRLGVELAITPSLFSDFDQDDDRGFRLPGHGAAAWTWNDTTKIVFGAAYLDRPDIDVIPIGGVIWKPHDDAEYEMIFPNPKLAHRVYWFGQYEDKVQDWIYLAAEFGGDSWTITHEDGDDDEVLLYDYRIILGLERKVIGGLDGRLELGYVFGREIRFYGSSRPDYDAGDTVMARLKLLY